MQKYTRAESFRTLTLEEQAKLVDTSSEARKTLAKLDERKPRQ